MKMGCLSIFQCLTSYLSLFKDILLSLMIAVNRGASVIFLNVFLGGGRQAMYFYKLIQYSATLTKLLIVSGSFLVEVFESHIYICISYVNRGNLNLSFSICIPLISFSSLIGPARTFSTILERGGVSGQHCFILYFNGIALTFPQFRIMLSLSVIYQLYYAEVCSLQSYTISGIYHEVMLDFIKVFFCIC